MEWFSDVKQYGSGYKAYTFLEKQVLEAGDKLDKLTDIRLAFMWFFIIVLLLGGLFSIAAIGQLQKGATGIAKVGYISYLIILPLAIIIGIVTFKQLNSLIKEVKNDFLVKKRELKAERDVQKFLMESLTEDYYLFTNIYTGYGDVDAVVVGPNGVFVIEVKSNSGVVSQDDKNRLVIIDGDPPRKNYRKQVIRNSQVIKRILDDKLNRKSFVMPILVFPFASVLKDIVLDSPWDNYKVPVLGKNEVVEYIYTHPQYTLSPDVVKKYAEALAEMETSPEE